MNEQQVIKYRMNPAEDEIRFGNELADDMWVLLESWAMRTPRGDSEDEKIRQQCFRRVTRLRVESSYSGNIITFVGEWVDGYQETHSFNESWSWLVKKENPGEGQDL